jgi:hypothetical protein
MRELITGLGTLVLSGLLAVGGIGGRTTSNERTRAASAPSVAPSATTPAVAVASIPPKPRVDQATVVLYGDSLAWEAEGFFMDALQAAGVTAVVTRTYGGTAICDWFEHMERDAVALRPTVVVIEFSGNAFTPCMISADGVSLASSREAYEQKYIHDAGEVVRIFSASATRIQFVGAPWGRGVEERNDPAATWLNRMYASLSASFPMVTYVDGGTVVLRDGHWTETLPCLPSEPCTAGTDANGVPVNVVRAPDGGHFCPVAADATRGVTSRCTVWASGAYRYGRVMADGVLGHLLTEPT